MGGRVTGRVRWRRAVMRGSGEMYDRMEGDGQNGMAKGCDASDWGDLC